MSTATPKPPQPPPSTASRFLFRGNALFSSQLKFVQELADGYHGHRGTNPNSRAKRPDKPPHAFRAHILMPEGIGPALKGLTLLDGTSGQCQKSAGPSLSHIMHPVPVVPFQKFVSELFGANLEELSGLLDGRRLEINDPGLSTTLETVRLAFEPNGFPLPPFFKRSHNTTRSSRWITSS